MSQQRQDEKQESKEKNERENEKKEHKESEVESGGMEKSSNGAIQSNSDEEKKSDSQEIESDDEEGESDDEERENDDEERESDDEERENDDEERENDDEERESDDEERESDDEEIESDDEEGESDDEERESNDEERESADIESESEDLENNQEERKSNQVITEPDNVQENTIAGRDKGTKDDLQLWNGLPMAENQEDRISPVRRRLRVRVDKTPPDEVLEMNQGPRSLLNLSPENDRGPSGKHQKKGSRTGRVHNRFSDRLYSESQSLDYEAVSGNYNADRWNDEQFQTLSPQFLVNVLIKCPNHCSTLLYFVENFYFRSSHIKKVVKENGHVFALDNESVILQPKIKLCTSHLSFSGCQLRLQCGDLHVCPSFITNHCMDENCQFGHKFKTNHNLRNLSDYYLNHLSSSKLKRFFLPYATSSENQGLIEICKDYIKGECQQRNCSALHICSDYMTNRLACPNARCQLNHNLLSPENCLLLRRFGIDTNEAPRDIFAILLEVNPAIGNTEDANRKVSGTDASHPTSDKIPRKSFEFVDDHHSTNNSLSDTGSVNEAGSGNESASSLPLIPSPVPVTTSVIGQSAENNIITVSLGATAVSDTNAQDHSITSRNNVPSGTNASSEGDSSVVVTQASANLPFRAPSTKELKVNIPSLWSHHLEGDVRVAEICYDSVVGICPREHHTCARLHSKRHFHWQVSEENESWFNLLPFQFMCLERSFCNPAIDSVSLPPLEEDKLESPMKFLLLVMGEDIWTANFQGMVLLSSDESRMLYLRRLCTEIIPGITVNPSIYHWFLCDDDGVWTEYGENEDSEDDYINSEVLECQYMINPNEHAQFTLSDGEYLLDFNTMTQITLSTQEAHDVRRRPKPHLPEVDEDLGNMSSDEDA